MLNGAAKKKKKKTKIFMYPFSIRLTSALVGYNIILKVLKWKRWHSSNNTLKYAVGLGLNILICA